ncbi:MAG: hypothetical protein KUA43_06145 [Hoeflea sp.]|uniref:hypothetical protein n=1 Tax=Hoeflea sp. TaxID=1940281 RepID=UPI001DEE01DD|nr:hypothetical protein [Hoeflea sp.]MBU4530211.1 hypothetical protein [Alphaproteobacteria bacterium]MBU4542504.1 hypothetical protein [Alphaproteobacteria bacterium]MBU4551185.1 hypothetical protein [Alphaproteobacteria bacterium]MBV1723008.1 hypothetical protein [Hoeflea sp.]MBV1760019.1 hypothetical protein [Hoeflea sp.]
MRTLSALALALIAVMSAAPAHALDFDQLLKRAFGTSDPSELGGPLFALIGLVAVLFFWGALRIGKRRQRRMIESYDADLKDYSTRLRRGKS